jgi:hypothetical protein
MANLSEPDEIVMNFLRSYVEEVTRVGLSNRQTTDSQNFNGDGGTKVFTLTLQPVAINSVTVGGSVMVPYLDYDIDLDSKKITFVSAPATGTNNVVVSFEKGSNWIYTDSPRDDLSKTSYPRMVVSIINESSSVIGYPEDDMLGTVTIQIDVLAYKDQFCTIGGVAKSGADVAQYLARDVVKQFRTNWRNGLKGVLFRPNIINNIFIPYDESNNLFHRIVTIGLDGFNIGE